MRFSVTGRAKIAAMMLTRREAAGSERRQVVDSVEKLDSQGCASSVEKRLTAQIAPGSTIAITARVKLPLRKCFGRTASSFSSGSAVNDPSLVAAGSQFRNLKPTFSGACVNGIERGAALLRCFFRVRHRAPALLVGCVAMIGSSRRVL